MHLRNHENFKKNETQKLYSGGFLSGGTFVLEPTKQSPGKRQKLWRHQNFDPVVSRGPKEAQLQISRVLRNSQENKNLSIMSPKIPRILQVLEVR